MFIRIPNKSVQGIERDHTQGHAAIHPSIFSTESFHYAANLAGFHVVWQEHMRGSGQSSFVLRKGPPTVSLFMIVKNEEKNILKCLQTVKPFVDEMIVLDTGSSDHTIREAKKAGAIVKRSKQFTVKTETKDFSFAAARNEAMSYATGDWLFWMDADDRFHASGFKLSEDLDAYNVRIQYGNSTFNHARIFRNHWGVRFDGAVHEFPIIDGCRTGFFSDGWVEHSTNHRPERIGRNMAILEGEHQRDPDNKRTMFYLGNAYREQGLHDKAIKVYQRYIRLGGNFSDELYLARYYLAKCFYNKKEFRMAIRECFEAIKLDDRWAEAYHQLGEAYFYLSEFKKAICYFGVAMSLPFPETGMFVAKELYDSSPKLWLSYCYEYLGMIDEAKKWATEHPDRLKKLKDRKFTIELQRPGALGDVLCTTAAVAELRKKYPNAHIRYVTHQSAFPILEGNPDINEVTDESKQADKIIQFNYPMREGYPDKPMRRHLGVYFAEDAEVSLSRGWKPVLHLLADSQVALEHKKPIITFAVRTGWSRYKEWPLERWSELIKAFPDYQFLQLGAAGEPKIEEAQYMCGKLTLRESFSVLKQSALFVGLDSVFNHVAAALEVPAVILFGSTSPIGSGYPSALNVWGNLECSPCYREDNAIAVHKKPPCPYEHECMASFMTVDRVIAAVKLRLQPQLAASHK
jgi:ADP-heptose:LPS heptosyltransferase/glycosyltransferase involved in cell wall biosynthesis